MPIIKNDNKLIDYVIDTPYHASPNGFKRWALLVTYDLEYTLKLKNKLENKIVTSHYHLITVSNNYC